MPQIPSGDTQTLSALAASFTHTPCNIHTHSSIHQTHLHETVTRHNATQHLTSPSTMAPTRRRPGKSFQTHCSPTIISSKLHSPSHTNPKKRVITQTNWDRFRLLRARETTTNYDLWIGSLRRTRSQTTTTIEADTPSDHPDPHLMRLWRRRKRLLSRIRIQPRNTQLRQKLDTLNTDILVHCSTLETTNWNRICDSMNSSLHTKSPWFLLRSLLGPQSAPSLPFKSTCPCMVLLPLFNRSPIYISPSTRFSLP